MNYLGWPLLTAFPPILAPLEGWLSSSNEGLFKFAHEHNPDPSTRLSIPAWSAVRWWGAGPFHRGARLHWSQHWPTPRCFALRDAKYGEVAVFQISQLSVVAGSHQALSPGRRPSEKAEGHTQTHATQKDCRLQRAALSALEKSWLSVLPNENSIPSQKKDKQPWRLLPWITMCSLNSKISKIQEPCKSRFDHNLSNSTLKR